MGKDNNQRKNVYFDVINSVKGGSGKTTFAFALAHTLSRAKVLTKVFVIDLDLRGSSWVINYKRFIGRDNGRPYNESGIKNPEYPFIDRLIAQYDYLETKEPWAYITTQKDEDSKKFYLCAADDQFSEQIGDIEVDIFEQTIYKLIMNGIKETDDEKEIHFILDMPPSYERHAERILKHLLISGSSILYNNKIFIETDPDANYNQYKVNLFMMAAASPDHIRQNYNYIVEWLKQRTYSDEMIHMLKDERLFIRPVISDVTDITIKNIEKELLASSNALIQMIREKISERADGDYWKGQIYDYKMIEHFPVDKISIPDEYYGITEPYTSEKLVEWESAVNSVRV